MAKFVKFKISNGTTLAAGGNYARDVLVNIDDIEKKYILILSPKY